MIAKLLFTVTCLVLPVAWGVAVNWVFDLWNGWRVGSSNDDTVFPDYQI